MTARSWRARWRRHTGGKCENPGCSGQAPDLTDGGDPILEVDHIHDLALGGPDDPAQMIALCPTAMRSRYAGRIREQLREVLFAEARRRHEALLAGRVRVRGTVIHAATPPTQDANHRAGQRGLRQ